MTRILQPDSVEFFSATIRESTGLDLTAVTVGLALAGGDEPTVWTAATCTVTSGVLTARALLSAATLPVDSTLYLWVRAVAGQQVIVRRLEERVVVAP